MSDEPATETTYFEHDVVVTKDITVTVDAGVTLNINGTVMLNGVLLEATPPAAP